MRRISPITAFTADVAMAVALYVLPWSPGSNTAATESLAQQAPTGMPFPSALARATTSGTTPSCWKPNHSPVRPRPVWISSTIINAPVRSHRSRIAARYPGGAGMTPPSPWIGSISTAPTVASTAASRASTSPHTTCLKPSGIGENGSCLAGWPVAASAARVRPWKLPNALTTTWRPRPPNFRPSFSAHSIDSAPELVKNVLPDSPVASPRSWLIATAAAVEVGLAK